MKVKRYRAEDRATALKQIRADLGSDAVIVHEHRVRTGGVFGMFGRVEVEILPRLKSDRLLHDPRPRRLADPQRSRPGPRRLPAAPVMWRRPFPQPGAVLHPLRIPRPSPRRWMERVAWLRFSNRCPALAVL